MPGEVTFRSPRVDEAEAVAAVLNAHAVAEIGVADTAAEDLRASWERPGRSPEDLVVAEMDGGLVAYLEVDAVSPWTSFRIDGYVHPDALGRGIGSALLERGERRAAALARQAPPGEPVKLFHGVWHGAPGARLLERRGWRLDRVFWEMRVELDGPPPRPTWPEGVTIRPVREGEEQAVHAAVSEAFEDHWEHRPIPFDRWVHQHRSDPGYDPTLWFVAMDGEAIAGVVLCKPFIAEDPEVAEIESVSVRRPWRRRGLALAMLQHAFGALHRRGIPRATLYVDADSPTGAPALYQRAGMREHRRIDVYAKQLTPEA